MLASNALQLPNREDSTSVMSLVNLSVTRRATFSLLRIRMVSTEIKTVD